MNRTGEGMQTGERRPIAAREFGPAIRLAEWLARIGVEANAISVAGMGFSIGAGLCAAATGWQTSGWLWIAAALLIELRLLANMLDGMAAIASGRASRRGELFNDAPDRVADIAVLVGFGYAAGGLPWLGYLAALAAVLTAYVRFLGVSTGTPAQFCGPMAKPHRMHFAAATALLCAILTLAAADPEGLMRDLALPAIMLAVVAFGSVGTALRRLARIYRALR
jgi:phosphatidylglycerophosphate synthase